MILETEFRTPEGVAVLTDGMQRRDGCADVLRLIRGVTGRVQMRMELCIRFDYGELVPWVTRLPDRRLRAIAGSDQLIFQCPIEHHGENLVTVADFWIESGQQIPLSLTWEQSFRPIPASPDVQSALRQIEQEWTEWSRRCTIQGDWAEPALRSLITLRALEDNDTGGIVAAATTSIPEDIGGVRNWDYRYCWLRDSTFTLYALMESGYHDEARAWREWLMRAIGGAPDKMRIMYGLAGERRLPEHELPHLSGYMNSRPVRIGNAAADQLQLDVFGEVLDVFYQSRRNGLVENCEAWNLQLALLEHLERLWREPDEGLWEVRGGRKNFTWSKIMCWVAFDRAVRTIEEFGEPGPVDRLRRARQEVREEIEAKGYNTMLHSFVQAFGSTELDASLLLIPIVGFLPASDPRVRSTVALIERRLIRDGLVTRYESKSGIDGLPGNEGVFLACSFWLADNYVLQGRLNEARALFERLLALRNDVGLLSEEYDSGRKRLVGNFPQAFSHVALVNTALNLTRNKKPAEHRGAR